MRAMPSFRREVGISVDSCSALLALRIRESMSATGSVSIGLPAGLGHARDDALVRELPQADSAEPELAEDGAGTSATVAARVVAHLVPLRAGLLDAKRCLGHAVLVLPSVRRERHPEAAQQLARLVVRLGGGRNRDVEAADLLDVVVVDLGKDDLLADAERVVAAAVERARAEAAEVADT